MEKDRFVERILETENLTDELEDAEANWLIEWGIQRLDDVLAAVEDEEQAGQKINELMAVMRKINRITGNYRGRDPIELANELAALADLFTQAYNGQDPRQADFDLTGAEFAARLAQLSPRQALEALAKGTISRE
jgi:hypothetical protein